MTANDLPDKKAVLSQVWLFEGLPEEALDRIVPYTRTVRFKSGETIIEKGDPGTSMMAVGKGRVKIRSVFWDGREIVFNIIDRGEVFGEIALLDGQKRTADAVAMNDTVLYVLERRDLQPILHRQPEIAIRLLSVLCDRVRRTSEQVEDLMFLDQPLRLAKVLLWLAKRYGRPSDEGVALQIHLSQRELGTLVGVRREAMNRQLSLWREAGLVIVENGIITIADAQAFETMVEALED